MGAEKIVKASDKLNKESMELSEGASEQASSAEEVSSSMEEMYANIQQNTDNSKETEKIAKKAAEGIKVSNQSNELAQRSLEDITEKISIIGDIAFQTNILALNAQLRQPEQEVKVEALQLWLQKFVNWLNAVNKRLLKLIQCRSKQ